MNCVPGITLIAMAILNSRERSFMSVKNKLYVITLCDGRGAFPVPNIGQC